jgi:hypothetical protein
MTGRLNGGQLVMQVLNQIAALKRQKKEEGWELEDRDLKKRMIEAQIGNYGEQSAPRQSELEMKIEILKSNPELYDRLFPRPAGPKTAKQIEEESAARARGTASVTGGTAASDDARKDAVDARKSFNADAKARKKRYDELMNQQGALEKQINSTKLLIAKANGSKDKAVAATLTQTLIELQLKKNILDGELDGMIKGLSTPPAQETIPPDVLAKAKAARPDLSDEEIIKAWQARKK